MASSVSTRQTVSAVERRNLQLGDLFAGDRDFQYLLDAIPKTTRLDINKAQLYADRRRRVLWIVFCPEMRYHSGREIPMEELPFSVNNEDHGLASVTNKGVAIWSKYFLGGTKLPGIDANPALPYPTRDGSVVDSWAVLFRDGDQRIRHCHAYDGVTEFTYIRYGDPKGDRYQSMKTVDASPVKSWGQRQFTWLEFTATVKMAERILDMALDEKIRLLPQSENYKIAAYANRQLLTIAPALPKEGTLPHPRNLAQQIFYSAGLNEKYDFKELWARYIHGVAEKIRAHINDRLPEDEERVTVISRPPPRGPNKRPNQAGSSSANDPSGGCCCIL